ncbi:DUF2877 domain-containing protein [Microbacterium sp. ASV81]|uniref:DUF2877 domain-containing protein n=1 Tax=Microbacterium capsulatum TaxID=3041921 RepID=A0ABU0XJV5_9MICO|nr:DUF2877 domain-containing protein [Microbacterium sp. ASV81]MDQ4215429.1 DUF2877 domain-containing protein [Microbacterium sp. ASV81]
MTPVATPISVRAITWDAALEETLSRAVDAAFPTPRSVLSRTPSSDAALASTPVSVHSVHRRTLNLRIDDELIALVSPELDDAPATVRVPVPDWTAFDVRPGDPALIGEDGLRIETTHGPIAILLSAAEPWTPSVSCLCGLSADRLLGAEERIAAVPAPAEQTAFGRIAAGMLAARIDGLGEALRDRDPDGITAAATLLLGLGEGLTPSGDDVLTGLSFLAAQPGMRLRTALEPLSAAIEDGSERTTLLSTVTARHALRARARQSLHDLVHAIGDDDVAAIDEAAARIAEIGHTSGTDILTGVRLALRTEAALRAASPDVPTAPTPGSDEKGAGR